MIFLVAYAFGCELWAPWSEDLGRWPILQLSLFLVNVWQIPCALAPNFSPIIAFRFLGGLSSAGGSVTLGMVADLWEADDQQYAVAYVVLSSVGGTSIGPFFGAFIQRHFELALELLDPVYQAGFPLPGIEFLLLLRRLLAAAVTFECFFSVSVR